MRHYLHAAELYEATKQFKKEHEPLSGQARERANAARLRAQQIHDGMKTRGDVLQDPVSRSVNGSARGQHWDNEADGAACRARFSEVYPV